MFYQISIRMQMNLTPGIINFDIYHKTDQLNYQDNNSTLLLINYIENIQIILPIKFLIRALENYFQEIVIKGTSKHNHNLKIITHNNHNN